MEKVPVFTMKGYEDYSPNVTYQRFFHLYNYNWKSLWYPLFDRYVNSMYVPMYNKDLHKDLSDFIGSLSYIPTLNDRVYFAEGCKIPRGRYKGLFKRVINRENANVLVVPDNIVKAHGYMFIIIFANDEHKQLVIYPMSEYEIRNNNIPYMPVNGDTFTTFFDENIKLNSNQYQTLNDDNRELCDKYKCIWTGFAITYEYPSTKYMLEEFDVPVKKNVKYCFESDLPMMFNCGDEEFTPEMIESLRAALGSEDTESISYALNTLANMDYAHYPSVVTFLIYEHNVYNKVKETKEIRFMKENIKKSVLPAFPFSNMNDKEFPLLKKYVMADLNKRIENTLKTFRTRANVDVFGTPGFDIKLKTQY